MITHLADTGETEKVVAALIRTAQGGHYEPEHWGRKHWYSLSRTMLSDEHWEFSADEQLAAIRTLGKTASLEALKFLIEFSQWRLVEEMTDHCLGGYMGTGKFQLRFPNARGELRDSLNNTRTISDWEVDKIREQGPLNYFSPAGSHLGPVGDKQIYGILAAAIEALNEAGLRE